MKIKFHKDAEFEFNQSIDYYHSISSSLATDFALEVNESIKSIATYPNAWSIIDDEIRRKLVNRFPYGVLYSIQNDVIYIVAVMNLRRNPEYWKDRTLP